MSHEIVLAGCTPIPLASYLKALGVLRLVAEQVDPDARGCWRSDQFVLISRLDEDGLEQFFLNCYQPTPLVAPWGARSGFYPGSSERTAREALEEIEKATTPRLAPFQSAIAEVRAVLDNLGFREKVRDEDKLTLLRACRAGLSDDLLQWLDACYVLTSNDRRFPPLLGTGGNEGSGSYASGFAQQIVNCIVYGQYRHALSTALFESQAPQAGSSQTPGQFAPNAAGGPNLGTGFSAPLAMNPWDYVLCLEGTVLFASALTRRLNSSATSTASFPFTVETTGAGSGGASHGDERDARAEMWLPLWDAPIYRDELRSLLGEGRVQLSRRQARDGLDFVRAVARLGIDRGIDAFQRYAIMQRFGRSVFAVPLNRVAVTRNPAADLADELDQDAWLARFRQLARGAQATHRIQSLVRRLEDALFELALNRNDPGPRVQRVLELLGEAQLYLARSPAARDSCPPVPSLSAEWLVRAQAGDGSPELAIAAAVAGLHGRRRRQDGTVEYTLPMRAHLAPEQPDRRPVWLDEEGHRVTWGLGRLEDNLLATLQQRLLEAQRRELDDKPLFPCRTAALGAVAAWLDGNLDSRRIASLLPGLALVRIPSGAETGLERSAPLPAAYRLLKPFFCTNDQLHRAGLIEEDRTLPIPAELIRRIAADDIAGAAKLGEHRLRTAGVPVRFPGLEPGRDNGRRLLAALLVPLTDFELKRLLPQRMEREAETENAD